MLWYMQIALGLVVCSASVEGQEPSPKPKATVELKWLEKERVEGITEEKGITTTCDPKSVEYMHKKPVFVLTAADFDEVRVVFHEVYSGILVPYYSVKLSLTKKARDRLAASCADPKGRMLAVQMDGKYLKAAVWPDVKEIDIVFGSKDWAERFAEALK
jgi:hypothetical protein